jgi:hypothetical protein
MGDDVPLIQDELLDKIVPRPVEIDRTGVALLQGPDSINGADDLACFFLKDGVAFSH